MRPVSLTSCGPVTAIASKARRFLTSRSHANQGENVSSELHSQTAADHALRKAFGLVGRMS